MSKSANVLSVQTLKDFKLAMINFAEEARNSLSGVDMELRRMRDWLERDQLGYWQSQIKKRQEDLMQARADLHKRKISQQGSDAVSDAEQKEALREATRELRVAEEKLAHGQAADSSAPPRDRRIPLAFSAAGRPSFGRVREEPVHSREDDRLAGGVPGTARPRRPRVWIRCRETGPSAASSGSSTAGESATATSTADTPAAENAGGTTQAANPTGTAETAAPAGEPLVSGRTS